MRAVLPQGAVRGDVMVALLRVYARAGRADLRTVATEAGLLEATGATRLSALRRPMAVWALVKSARAA